MNNLERRVDRLENPSQGVADGLAEALDALRQRPGEPPRVRTAEDEEATQALISGLQARLVTGPRLSSSEAGLLGFLTQKVPAP